MKKVALSKAADHLELAKAAAEKLDLASGPKAYSRAWSDFLSQSSRFYSKLEQGAKGCKTSEPWFGRKRHERRKDPLLSYIHHARDTDEHGLDYVVAETGSRLNVHMAEGAERINTSFEMMVDSQGKVHIRNPQTTTPESVSAMELVEPRMELVIVKDNRFNDSFHPPSMHLDRPIVFNSPATVANLMIAYLSMLLDEAATLPEHT